MVTRMVKDGGDRGASVGLVITVMPLLKFTIKRDFSKSISASRRSDYQVIALAHNGRQITNNGISGNESGSNNY
jgi:hypothetical protein